MKTRISTLFVFSLVSALMSMAQKTVTFDFIANPWGLETCILDDLYDDKTKYTIAKIDDDRAIPMEEVTLHCHKSEETKYYNRIMDDYFTCYPHNSISLAVPQGWKMTKIEFDNKRDRFSLREENTNLGTLAPADEEKDRPYIWQGSAEKIRFKGFGLKTQIKKIHVTLEPTNTTGIAQMQKGEKLSSQLLPVYTLAGVRVGTMAGWDALPKGIYIVGGKKMIK